MKINRNLLGLLILLVASGLALVIPVRGVENVLGFAFIIGIGWSFSLKGKDED